MEQMSYMTLEELFDFLKREILNSFNRVDDLFKSAVFDDMDLSTGWSQIELLEHIMLANKYLIKLIQNISKKAAKIWQNKSRETLFASDYLLADEKLMAVGKNGSFSWKPPEHMMPSGKYTPKVIRKEFLNQRDCLLEILDSLRYGQGIFVITTLSVNGIGKIDVYQYIYFLLLHMKRHISSSV
jgi:hypothetical protein